MKLLLCSTILLFMCNCLLYVPTFAQKNNNNKQLIEAVKQNDTTRIKLLIANGANVNALDENNASVLMWAIYKGNINAVKLLVQNKAVCKNTGLIYINEEKSSYYFDLVAVAAGENHSDVLTYLIDSCKLPIELRYNPVSKKDDGLTALQFSSYMGNDAAVKILINKGANINTHSKYDFITPLNAAFLGQNYETAKYLLEIGADPSISLKSGWSALHFAARDNYPDLLQLILDKGVEPNVLTVDSGYTPLYLSAFNNNIKAAFILLQNNANLNIRAKNGKTPLEIAKLNGSTKVANYLQNPERYKSPDEVYTWKELDDKLSNLIKKYGNKEAIEIGKKASFQALDEFGENHINYSKSLYKLGEAYRSNKQNDKAAEFFNKAIKSFETKQNFQTEDYASCCNSLGLIHLKKKEYNKAIEIFKKSKAVSFSDAAKQIFHQGLCCNNIGLSYKKLGNLDKAIPLMEEANAKMESLGVYENKYYDIFCTNLINAYLMKDSLNKALEAYKVLIKIKAATYGHSHIKYAQTCNKFAILYFESLKFKEAEPLFIVARKIFGEKQGWDDKGYLTITNNLIELYKLTEEFNKAEELLLETLSNLKQTVGVEHDGYVLYSSKLASIYIDNKEFEKAEPLIIKVKETTEKLKNKKSEAYVSFCNNYALLLKEKGNLSEAETYLIEAKNRCIEFPDNKGREYRRACIGLVKLYIENNEIAKARLVCNEIDKINNEKLKGVLDSEAIYLRIGKEFLLDKKNKEAHIALQELRNVCQKMYGKDSEKYAASCNYFASYYRNQGDYEQAIKLNSEIKRIWKKSKGTHSAEYAQVCNELANCYLKKGDYNEALTICKEAKFINETIFGKLDLGYALSCNYMGMAYKSLGQFNYAEKYYLESKNIRERLLGKEHYDYASSCNNLAMLYKVMGNYTKAESLSEEFLNTCMIIYGEESHQYATACNNLASIYYSNQEYYKALALHIKAKDIRKRVRGTDHLEYAISCDNLADTYARLFDYTKAEKLALRANEIKKRILGTDHPDYILSCNNLAVIYDNFGQYAKAISLYDLVREKTNNHFGKKHYNYITSCLNLATLYDKMAEYKKAEELFVEVAGIMDVFSSNSARFMSEQEREKYLNEKVNFVFDAYASFFLTKRNKNHKLNGIIYNNAINLKGQLLKSSISLNKAIIASGDSLMLDSYRIMNNYAKILSTQYTLPSNKRRTDIDKIEEKLNSIEKELVQKIAGKKLKENVKWKDIQKSLKEDELAVEFIRFQYRNEIDWSDSTLYYAIILKKGYKYPKAEFLFEEKELEELLERKDDESDYEYVKRLYTSNSENSKLLYQKVFEPIEKHLKDVKTIYLSPTGLLNRVAFDAIIVENKDVIADKYKLNYLSSTALITENNELYKKDITSASLFGGINYSIDVVEMQSIAEGFKSKVKVLQPLTPFNKVNEISYENLVAQSRSLDSLSRNVSWSYLPGSLEETEKIKITLDINKIKNTLYKDEKASEEQFKELVKHAPGIVHISTHGYYFGDDKKSSMYKSMIDDNVKFAHSVNPLLRSGFILAGGNNAFQGKSIPNGVEDGVLTALEISHMNLYQTKLAVLSACQTGLGDVKGSEGVYGLQRAFKMAGVEYLLFSLWEVPDHQTQELMVYFYENWFSGLEINAAFKKAQLQLKNKYSKTKGSAYAWASFVLMR